MNEPDASPGLVVALHGALDETTLATPAAVLARVYAQRIDECSHVRLALDKALSKIEAACSAQEDPGPYLDAYAKVAAALAAVTVARELGPHLLATLDALLITPKSKAMLAKRLPGGPEVNPLAALRDQHDELQARRDRRHAGG